MPKRLLKGARVVDPSSGRDGMFDVLIEDGRIAHVGNNLEAGADATVVEMPGGLVICPRPAVNTKWRVSILSVGAQTEPAFNIP